MKSQLESMFISTDARDHDFYVSILLVLPVSIIVNRILFWNNVPNAR